MTQKRTKRTTITRSLADKLSQKLEQLPEKKKTELTPKEFIRENSLQLEIVLNKGYSYDDLIGILKDDGIQLSKTTLRQYLSEARKHRANPNEGAEDKTHQADKTLAHSDKKQPLPEPSVHRTLTQSHNQSQQQPPNKLSKGRLQSDENPDRYPDGYGKPLEIKTDL